MAADHAIGRELRICILYVWLLLSTPAITIYYYFSA